MDKRALVDQIIAQLTQELAALTAAAKAAHQAATHEESKPEDQYDTRGLEASYLAGAQAQRALELEKLIGIFRGLPVREARPGAGAEFGSLIELEVAGRRVRYLLAPQGGGVMVKVPGGQVQVITPQAPLGEALLGRKVGEEFEVEVQNAVREYVIVAIS